MKLSEKMDLIAVGMTFHLKKSHYRPILQMQLHKQLILGLKTSKVLKLTKYQLNIIEFATFHSQNTLQT